MVPLLTRVVTLACFVAACFSCAAPTEMDSKQLHPTLASTVAELLKDTSKVDAARLNELNDLVAWVHEELAVHGHADLTFICTHNSRRSHMAQVWAQVGADIAGLEGVQTYSGGTEATACNPRTVAALKRAGFEVAVADTLHGSTNPTYEVGAGPGLKPMRCFSKTYSHEVNPTEGYGAVMTCSSADRGCPVVYGSATRFSTPYVDPKVSDGTALEDSTYDARLREIGVEMLYVMSQVALARTRRQ